MFIMTDNSNPSIEKGAIQQPIEGQQTPAATGNDDEPITLTKRELELKLQSEGDKRVNQALKTHEQKIVERYEERIKLEREDAAKTAKMTADEKADHERKLAAKHLEDKEKVLAEKELKLSITEHFAEVKEDVRLVPFVIGSNLEDTKTRLEALNEIIKDKVEALKSEWVKSNSDSSIKSQNSRSGSDKTVFTREELKTPEGRKAYREAGSSATIKD